MINKGTIESVKYQIKYTDYAIKSSNKNVIGLTTQIADSDARFIESRRVVQLLKSAFDKQFSYSVTNDNKNIILRSAS